MGILVLLLVCNMMLNSSIGMLLIRYFAVGLAVYKLITKTKMSL